MRTPRIWHLIASFFFCYLSANTALSQGFIPPPPEELDKLRASTPPAFGAQLEEVVTLREQVPLPTRTPQEGESCVGWAIGYGLLSSLINREEQSPNYVYHWALDIQTRHRRPLKDTGVYDFETAFLAVNSQGSCKLEQYHDFRSEPSQELITKSKTFPYILSAAPLVKSDLTLGVKSILNSGKAVPAGFHFYSSFADKSAFEDRVNTRGQTVKVWHKAGTFQRKYHAMLIIGYDDKIKAFEVLNSHGTGFGTEGYVWIDYDFFESKNPRYQDNDPYYRDLKCCVCAYEYTDLPRAREDINHVVSSIQSGDASGWIRIVQPFSSSREATLQEFNFVSESGEKIDNIDRLSSGTKLKVKPGFEKLFIRTEFAVNTQTGNTMIAPEAGSLKSGDEIEVIGLKKVILNGGKKFEYWVKGKISN